MECFQQFSISFPTDPKPKEKRWLEQPFFHNPKILFGSGRNKRPYTPRKFGLTEKASTLSLGQLFVNVKPISREDLKNLVFETQIFEHIALQRNLKSHIGQGKTFNGCPKKVTIKSNPDKATSCNLIDNITDYMKSFKKGSAQIRKVFKNANPREIKIDLNKKCEH